MSEEDLLVQAISHDALEERDSSLTKRILIRGIGSPFTQVKAGSDFPIGGAFMGSNTLTTIDIYIDGVFLVSDPGVEIAPGGTFQMTIATPSTLTAGTHEICASLEGNQYCFNIPVCTTVCHPTLGFLNGQGFAHPTASLLVGSEFTLVGDAFQAGEGLTIRLDPPTGPVLAINTVFADNTGRFSMALTLPRSEPLGSHLLNANGTGIVKPVDNVNATFSIVRFIDF